MILQVGGAKRHCLDVSNSPCPGFEDNPEASQAATAVVTSVERFGSELAFFWFEYVDDDDDDDDDHDKMLPLMKSRLAELGGQRLDLTLFAPQQSRLPILGHFLRFSWVFRCFKEVIFIERKRWGKDSRITPHPVFFFGLQRHAFCDI